MKRVIVFFVLMLGFQGFALSQYANPFISISMNPFRVQPGKTATLEVQAGNAGDSPIQPNTILITITTGEHTEMTGTLGPGSDPRWTIQSVGKGPGNTMELVNSGKGPFNAFDLGKVYVIFRGKANSPKPNVISAFIKYVRNAEQGNASSMDDQSTTSLWVGMGNPPANTAKPTPVIVRQQQDLAISGKECDVTLSWKTNSTNKPEKIEVEYSKNNIEFTNLGEARPKDGTANDYEYQYYQGVGRGYYRLKLFFPGNVIEYSKLKEIATTCVVKKGF